MHEIPVHDDLRASNDEVARLNRRHFTDHGVYVINLMSGPGAGKTMLLERTVESLSSRWRIAVIEGDIQTSRDAKRIARHGVRAIQINTKGACHLDARQIASHMKRLNLDQLDLVFIENVGNLVCPAEFDLGEHDKVMLLSVTEGDDKPAKYPVMFHAAQLMLINKTDLLPYVDFDVASAEGDARSLNADLTVLPISARAGQGLDEWYRWLEDRMALHLAE
ncbi:MAG: hydrogenase nickel incorporation protein HypB [Proteobacteria bacterium]|jgi:hydrogenase nickel incorporation protein HypB|nr:hydrogenase nickel incorporation protein HypB [Pseudomonadota bacterium]